MAEGGCEVWFYHLEKASLDRVLPELLQKTLAKGWRALVRSSDPERIEHLDGWLWSFRDESFLPHGVAEEPHAGRQPVLLTTGSDNPNGAQALFLLDGAEPMALDGFERCILVFDGRDEAAVGEARRHWKDLRAEGRAVSYWKQGAEGGWQQQA